MSPELVVIPPPQTVAGAAIAGLPRAIRLAIAQHGACNLVLAGGTTPRAAYEGLVGQPIDWSKVHVWFGDERCVPPDHEASNFKMANDALLTKVAIPADQVHRIRGELPATDAAAEYDAHVAGVRFDIVLLGMGNDGHTASLFPGSDALESDALVVPTESPFPPLERVSMTLRAINSARFVVVLAAGLAKAPALADVFAERASGRPRLPAARVQPTHGELTWIVDPPAAALLPVNTDDPPADESAVT